MAPRYGASVGADFRVRVAAGSLRGGVHADATLPHKWTEAGVAIEVQFTGAHLLHLSAAACVLNDVYREAVAVGVVLNGVLVAADGYFSTESWRSSGVSYQVQIDSPADHKDLARLLGKVDEVAEIPRALRAGVPVQRVK